MDSEHIQKLGKFEVPYPLCCHGDLTEVDTVQELGFFSSSSTESDCVNVDI